MSSRRKLIGGIALHAAFLTVCWLGSTETVTAVEVLDQQSVIPSGIADSVSSAQEIAQTFTAGVAGTLSRIEVFMAQWQFNLDPFVSLTVYGTNGGVPTTSLGTTSISSAPLSTTAPTYVSFDVSSFQIPVHVNDVFAFGIDTVGGLYFLPYDAPNPYLNGSSFRRTLSTPPGPWQNQNHDNGFKTYVNVASLLGDYNGNHVVDAADYTVWRDLVGAPAGALPNDATPAAVDNADFTYWKTHFGESMGSGGGELGTLPVPEPASIVTAAIALAGIVVSAAARSLFCATIHNQIDMVDAGSLYLRD